MDFTYANARKREFRPRVGEESDGYFKPARPSRFFTVDVRHCWMIHYYKSDVYADALTSCYKLFGRGGWYLHRERRYISGPGYIWLEGKEDKTIYIDGVRHLKKLLLPYILAEDYTTEIA